jgi:lysyl-tRNA synthetase class I
LTEDSSNSIETLVNLAIYYLGRDANPDSFKNSSQKQSKYEEFSHGNLEDALTKIIKLLANLSTEETQAARDLVKLSSTTTLTVFFGLLMAAINRR